MGEKDLIRFGVFIMNRWRKGFDWKATITKGVWFVSFDRKENR